MKHLMYVVAAFVAAIIAVHWTAIGFVTGLILLAVYRWQDIKATKAGVVEGRPLSRMTKWGNLEELGGISL